MSDVVIATGRRKEAAATVRLTPGSGKITINGRTPAEYFARETLVMLMEQPLVLIEGTDQFDLKIKSNGGGLAGQAGAVRLGIARALLKNDESLRKQLRVAGLLTRDSRMVERKKPGQPGARKRFQFSKR